MILTGYMKIAKEGKEARIPLLNDFLMASNYAGIAFGNAGCAAVHALSYPLGAMYESAVSKAFHPAVKETPVIALNVTSGAGNLLSSPFVPSSSLSHATVIQEIQATKNNIIFFIPKYLKFKISHSPEFVFHPLIQFLRHLDHGSGCHIERISHPRRAFGGSPIGRISAVSKILTLFSRFFLPTSSIQSLCLKRDLIHSV